MIKIQQGSFDLLVEQSRSVFENNIKSVLQKKLEQTTVIIRPRTCYKVRDAYHNSHKSFNNGKGKVPFESLQTVKDKLLGGVPYIVHSNGKEEAFQLESDAANGNYNNSVLVPRLINLLIKSTIPKLGVMSFYGVKLDVKSLSINERALFGWMIKLHCLDTIYSYYSAYMQTDTYYIYGSFIMNKIKVFANEAVVA